MLPSGGPKNGTGTKPRDEGTLNRIAERVKLSLIIGQSWTLITAFSLL